MSSTEMIPTSKWLEKVMSLNPSVESLRDPLRIEQTLLMSAGQTNVPESIQASYKWPESGYFDPDFTTVMNQCKSGMQYLFKTKSHVTFAVPGTGNAAMECAVMNLLESGDVLLVVVAGDWGHRAAALGKRLWLQVETIEVPEGEVCDLATLEERVKERQPRAVFVCHGESSTGVLQPLEGWGQICHEHDALLIVDAVASAGAVELPADEWELDCVFTASHKVLNAPAGLSPIMFSERAVDRISNRISPVPSFYLDAVELGNYWACFDEKRHYHHAAMGLLVYALRTAFAEFFEQGLEQSIRKHAENAAYLRLRLEEAGFELFVQHKEHRLDTLTTVKVPEGVCAKRVKQQLLRKERIEIGVGTGPTLGKTFKIGTFGCNSDKKKIDRVVGALRELVEAGDGDSESEETSGKGNLEKQIFKYVDKEQGGGDRGSVRGENGRDASAIQIDEEDAAKGDEQKGQEKRTNVEASPEKGRHPREDTHGTQKEKSLTQTTKQEEESSKTTKTERYSAVNDFKEERLEKEEEEDRNRQDNKDLFKIPGLDGDKAKSVQNEDTRKKEPARKEASRSKRNDEEEHGYSAKQEFEAERREKEEEAQRNQKASKEMFLIQDVDVKLPADAGKREKKDRAAPETREVEEKWNRLRENNVDRDILNMGTKSGGNDFAAPYRGDKNKAEVRRQGQEPSQKTESGIDQINSESPQNTSKRDEKADREFIEKIKAGKTTDSAGDKASGKDGFDKSSQVGIKSTDSVSSSSTSSGDSSDTDSSKGHHEADKPDLQGSHSDDDKKEHKHHHHGIIHKIKKVFKHDSDGEDDPKK